MNIIERAEELLSKATPGPWRINPDRCIDGLINIHARYGLTAQTDHMDNAQLIAESPTLIQGLIDLVKQQQEENTLQRRYIGFLKSVIRSGETIDDSHDIEWFKKSLNGGEPSE